MNANLVARKPLTDAEFVAEWRAEPWRSPFDFIVLASAIYDAVGNRAFPVSFDGLGRPVYRDTPVTRFLLDMAEIPAVQRIP